ncbi:MAG: hypothetical protein GMKNLPBB_00975 [Myxococcota bacterium]|nr:hypothetical protein [Myxococcota bacterium]
MNKNLLVLLALGGVLACAACSGGDGGTDAGTRRPDATTSTCQSDNNCQAGETCSGGICVRKCASDTDCTALGPGFKCSTINNTCFQETPADADGGSATPSDGAVVNPGSCISNEECKPDRICVAGKCDAPSTCNATNADTACPVGWECNTLSQQCKKTQTGCTADSDCTSQAPKTKCNTATGQCEEPPKTCSPPCLTTERCNPTTLTCEPGGPAGCTSDAMCPPGQKCNTAIGQCESPPDGGTTDGGGPTTPCSSNIDCLASGIPGAKCINNLCQAPPPPKTCTTDTDCDTAAGEKCNSGSCGTPPGSGGPCAICAQDGDCDATKGLTCGRLSKKCIVKCQADTDCAAFPNPVCGQPFGFCSCQ